jgi:hypothetical protein
MSADEIYLTLLGCTPDDRDHRAMQIGNVPKRPRRKRRLRDPGGCLEDAAQAGDE